MSETRDVKSKRLAMRSMRRGIKEMDLILSDFAATALGDMTDGDLDLYDALLSENDHDLYQWVTGQIPTPQAYLDLMTRIAAGAKGLTRPL